MTRPTFQLPIEANSKEVPLVPNKLAVASVDDTSVTTSEQKTLPTGSSLIEVAAFDNPVLLAWGSRGSVTNTTTDSVVQPGTIRHLVVPSGETTVYLKSYDGSAVAKCLIIGWI